MAECVAANRSVNMHCLMQCKDITISYGVPYKPFESIECKHVQLGQQQCWSSAEDLTESRERVKEDRRTKLASFHVRPIVIRVSVAFPLFVVFNCHRKIVDWCIAPEC